MAVNEIIGRMRTAAKVRTDLALAAMLDVSRVNVASWRRRGSVPLSVLRKFAARTDVSIDWLLTGRQSPPPRPSPIEGEGDVREVTITLDIGDASGLRGLLRAEIRRVEHSATLCAAQHSERGVAAADEYLAQLRRCEAAATAGLERAVGRILG